MDARAAPQEQVPDERVSPAPRFPDPDLDFVLNAKIAVASDPMLLHFVGQILTS
jgi:hypothetical protein